LLCVLNLPSTTPGTVCINRLHLTGKMRKQIFISLGFLLLWQTSFCWGFFAHRKINYYAVFLLPPEMLAFYKQNIEFIESHAIDPDKRRYAVADEAPRHYIDINEYGEYPYPNLPRNFDSACQKFGRDTVLHNGIVPWWIVEMEKRLTDAFKEKNATRILRLSAEIGHYIGDSHVPLHASSNHDGQHTNQKGIHGFWEGRIPELLADKEFDFFIGKAAFISDVDQYVWRRVLESAAAADTVLLYEKKLSEKVTTKYSFENRNGLTVRQYSSDYSIQYNNLLNGMVERRMRQSIFSVASFWYTAWVNAGSPNLSTLNLAPMTAEEQAAMKALDEQWKLGKAKGRICD
jgi:hypothetical protein